MTIKLEDRWKIYSSSDNDHIIVDLYRSEIAWETPVREEAEQIAKEGNKDPLRLYACCDAHYGFPHHRGCQHYRKGSR